MASCHESWRFKMFHEDTPSESTESFLFHRPYSAVSVPPGKLTGFKISYEYYHKPNRRCVRPALSLSLSKALSKALSKVLSKEESYDPDFRLEHQASDRSIVSALERFIYIRLPQDTRFLFLENSFCQCCSVG